MSARFPPKAFWSVDYCYGGGVGASYLATRMCDGSIWGSPSNCPFLKVNSVQSACTEVDRYAFNLNTGAATVCKDPAGVQWKNPITSWTYLCMQ